MQKPAVVRTVSLTITITEGERELAVSYNTTDHSSQITGLAYPRDLRLVSALVEMVKAEHKHGPHVIE